MVEMDSQGWDFLALNCSCFFLLPYTDGLLCRSAREPEQNPKFCLKCQVLWSPEPT